MDESTRTITGGVRDLRECTICGEQVTVSNATAAWEARHAHADPAGSKEGETNV